MTVPPVGPVERCLVAWTCAALRVGFRVLGGLRVTGMEHLPARGPAILAGNHLSWADPPLIRCVMPRRCWLLANDFLFERPILGRLIPYFGAIPVRRGAVDRTALHRAEEVLRAGGLLCIFPEGGTTLTGRLSPFESGIGLLAVRTGAPIVPFALTGTDGVLPDGIGFPRYTRGGVTLQFGPPLTPPDPGEGDRRAAVDTLTADAYRAVAAMLPHELLPDDPDAPPTVALAKGVRAPAH